MKLTPEEEKLNLPKPRKCNKQFSENSKLILRLERQNFQGKQLLKDNMMKKDSMQQDSNIRLELILREPRDMIRKSMQLEWKWRR